MQNPRGKYTRYPIISKKSLGSCPMCHASVHTGVKRMYKDGKRHWFHRHCYDAYQRRKNK